MSEKQTFQETAGKIPLEKYEWDRIWQEDTYDTASKRVVYIGDSISEGTYPQCTKLSEREFVFNNFASSKAVDNPHHIPMLKMFIEQNEKCDAVIFNNGLHGWHLSEQEYYEGYKKTVKALLSDYAEIPFFIVLTTWVDSSNSVSDRVVPRNEMALKVAKELNLPVIDLYKVAKANAQLIKADGVHFSEEGYEQLAKEIIKVLKETL